jgi:thiaminase/transcriptional activator TenA
MLGAEWLYHTWCSAAVRTPSRRAFVADWVALHAGGGFADHVAWLRGWLDAYGETVDAAAAARLAGLFKRVLEAEIVFHDAAYDTGGEQERS